MTEAVVEKDISEDLLESAIVSFGPKEQELLGLPEHSGEVILDLDGDEVRATWNARSRHLTGEALADRLQEFAQVGWLIRFIRNGEQLRAAIVERTSSTLRADRFRPRQPRTNAPRTPKKSGRRDRSASARYRILGAEEYEWKGPIGLHRESLQELTSQISEGGWDPLEMLQLRLEGERLAALDQFEELLSVDVAKVDRMDHQEAAARKVLTAMQGRGVLADEVGLGKTIEAGLIVKELRLRGLVDRVLVLCPATLREQWRAELAEKFDEDFDVAYSTYDTNLHASDRLILSLTLGIRNYEKLNRKPWDLVIVDEAHRLAGRGANKTRTAIGVLTDRSRYVLFLTATPVQNELGELYRLVELLRPGTFPSRAAFNNRYVDKTDPRKPVKADQLRRLVSQVMVRTTRTQAGLDRVSRHATDHAVKLTKPEVELYDLCTNALRRVMTDPSDAHRRRTLAHRLTASPRSLSASALRMATRHPDPRAVEVLNEIGHLASDIRGTAREQHALARIHDWVSEHGRVLVFTQHTDTVQGLMQVLDGAGVGAVPFHGGMAADARARSIEAFRSGTVPVLVSTDAGAEGQNLQFCNCVLNYDLPWNPMRIEQRIGRVHRVTQTRDVHVANLFAVGTIDEHVYRLLHDKLRMFELLFGQVTTILGELDPADNKLTFEGRILEAFTAPDEKQMRVQLDKLGDQLADATARANEQIGSDEGLSAWLTETEPRAHRAKLTKSGATELQPEVVKRRRERQTNLVSFVESYLKVMGAEIVHRAGDRFLSARLPADLAEEVGGTDTLHLAFDRAGLDDHPEAELCAVGSEIFEEIVRSLRRRGDLYATVAIPPEIESGARITHSSDVELIERVVAEPSSWTAHTTWRATVGDGGHEEIIEIVVGDPARKGRKAPKRQPVPAGSPLPKTIGGPAKVTNAVWKGVAGSAALQTVVEKATADRDTRRDTEQSGRLERMEERLVELQLDLSRTSSAPKQSQLLAEIRSVERAHAAFSATGASEAMQLRAHPLTISFTVGDELMVLERWRHKSGVVREVSYPLEPGDPAPTYESDCGGGIEVLALCQDGHLVDGGQQFTCSACSSEWCDACDPEKALGPCRLCTTEVCGQCRPEGLCPVCDEPARRPDLDTSHELAWQVGGTDNLLYLAERSARLVLAGQEERVVVPDEDVDDDARVAARAVAHLLGLTPDAGVKLVGNVPDDPWTGATILEVTEEVSATLATFDSGGSSLDDRAVALLPEADDLGVVSERGAGVKALLARLRITLPPPEAPAIAATPYREVTVTELVASGLRRSRWRQEADRTHELLSETDAPLRAIEDDYESPFVLVADADLGDIHLDVSSVHRSLFIEATSDRVRHKYFVPGFEGATLAEERAIANALCHLDLDTRTTVDIDLQPWIIQADEWAQPSSVSLTHRDVKDIWRLLPAEALGGESRPAATADIDLLGLRLGEAEDETEPDERYSIVDEPYCDAGDDEHVDLDNDDRDLEESIGTTPLAGELGAELLRWSAEHALADRPSAIIRLDHRQVTELWTGETEAERQYVVVRDTPPWPWLDDEHVRASDFEIDDEGHLHGAGLGWTCGACGSSKCRACGDDGALGPCPGCDVPTCGRCRRSGLHDVRKRTCERCGAHSCKHCQRVPEVRKCELCERRVCRACRTANLCTTCSELRPAGADETADLPPALAAHGLHVLVSTDEKATVVALAGSVRCELAIVADGQITRWTTFERGRERDDLDLRLRLATVGAASGDATVGLLPTDTPQPLDEPALRVGPEARRLLRFGNQSNGERSSWATVPFTSTSNDPRDVVRRALPQAVLPARHAGRVVRRVRELQSAVQSTGDVVGLQVVEDVEAVFVTARGLVRRSRLAEESTETAQWLVAPVPGWAQRSWNPVPTRCATASIGGVDAALVAHGDAWSLGVRYEDGITWRRITRDDDEARRLLFGAAIGRPGQRIDIAAVANAHYIPPVIHGARFSHRSVASLLLPSSGAPDRDGFRELVRSWSLVPASPRMVAAAFPKALAADLTDADPLPPPEPIDVVEIGLKVNELWGNAYGQRPIEYDVIPGVDQALVLADDTGEAAAEVELDREGHLAALPASCSYCQGRTCRRCQAGVAWCQICQIPVCGRCTSQRQPHLRLCTACGSLKGTARWAHRRLDIDVPSKASVWTGKDWVHKVYCVDREGSWSVTADVPGRGRFTVNVGPDQQQLLTQFLRP